MSEPHPHPVTLELADDLTRSRLTVFFRLLLAIPHLVWVSVWSIGFLVVATIAWVAAMLSGRVPDGMHAFLAAYLVYQNRVLAYTLLLADPFPPFTSAGDYPVELRIGPPEEQSRLTVFFRWLLAIPAFVIGGVLIQLAQLLALFAWFVCIFTGRMPEGMRDLGAYCVRYFDQMDAYAFLLTPRYPSLAGGPTGAAIPPRTP